MTSRFQVTFTWYSKAKAQRKNSDVTFIHAEDFRGAVQIAEAMVEGMRSAAPEGDEIEISGVTRDGLGGESCSRMHGGIWAVAPRKED